MLRWISAVPPHLAPTQADPEGLPLELFATLLAGMFNLTPAPTVLELLAWTAYAVPVLVLFLRAPGRTAASGPRAPHPTPQNARA